MWKFWTSRKSNASKEKVGYFSPEKRALVLKWLEEKWLEDRRECECCGSKKWAIPNNLVTPLVFIGDLSLNVDVYPNFMVVCNNCGYTKYFNAILAGVEAKR